jgi:hypothetical protein
MPFSVHTMAWLGEHHAFVVEEFLQNGCSPRHISTFKERSTNKISGTGLTITIGNFTKQKHHIYLKIENIYNTYSFSGWS